jgi:thioredoxin reductase (NADPH)
MTEKIHDLVIVGAGPAGMTAGIYGKRYMMDCIVIGPEVGGIATQPHMIDNWPGFKGPGMELMTRFREHLESFGVPIIEEDVKEIKRQGDRFEVSTEKKKYLSRTILLAMGTKRRKLDIPGEEDFFGRGVSYCATCDCVFFKNKTVAVIGGGDAATMAAQILSQHASKVYIIYRKGKDEMKTELARLRELEKDPKIEFMFNTNLTKISGSKTIERVTLDNGKELKLDGVFVEIGGIPMTALAKTLGIALSENGKIKVGVGMDTNIPGAYGAGDITTGSNNFNQIVTAAAEGAIAAQSAFHYVKQQKAEQTKE